MEVSTWGDIENLEIKKMRNKEHKEHELGNKLTLS